MNFKDIFKDVNLLGRFSILSACAGIGIIWSGFGWVFGLVGLILASLGIVLCKKDRKISFKWMIYNIGVTVVNLVCLVVYFFVVGKG